MNNLNAYDLFQNIIKKNNLEIVNDFFSYIYADKNELQKDLNNLNFKKFFNKMKNKNNLNIVKKISLNLEDIYFNNYFELNIKRQINKKFHNFKIELEIDIYDDEIVFNPPLENLEEFNINILNKYGKSFNDDNNNIFEFIIEFL